MSIFSLNGSVKKEIEKFKNKLSISNQKAINAKNFQNLAQAYEQRLNDLNGGLIPKDEVRLDLMARLLGTPPSEAYSIVEALVQSSQVEGDVCEFGVAQGETSALIANEIKSNNKTFHLFDSFEGLPEPTEEDRLKDDIFALGSMKAYAGKMACAEQMVLTRFEAISFPENRFVIHKGFVDETFEKNIKLPTKVSFAYVDFDFYEPIKITLEYLHAVTSIGSVIIVDDYNFFSTGVKKSVDEFLKDKNASENIYRCDTPCEEYGYYTVITRLI